MSGRRSREKGQRGEREWAAACTAEGFPAHRGRQYHGGQDSPDVRTALDHAIHFEVKHTERLSLYDAMQQATEDAGERMPVVAHRRNNHEWLVVLKASDFFRLVRESEIPTTDKESR